MTDGGLFGVAAAGPLTEEAENFAEAPQKSAAEPRNHSPASAHVKDCPSSSAARRCGARRRRKCFCFICGGGCPRSTARRRAAGRRQRAPPTRRHARARAANARAAMPRRNKQPRSGARFRTDFSFLRLYISAGDPQIKLRMGRFFSFCGVPVRRSLSAVDVVATHKAKAQRHLWSDGALS